MSMAGRQLHQIQATLSGFLELAQKRAEPLLEDTLTNLSRHARRYEERIIEPAEEPSLKEAVRVSWYELCRDPVFRWLVQFSERALPFLVAGIAAQHHESRYITQHSNGVIPPFDPGETRYQFSGEADLNAADLLTTALLTALSLAALKALTKAYGDLSSKFPAYWAFLNIAGRAAFLSAGLWGLHYAANNSVGNFSSSDLDDSFILTVIFSALGSAIWARLFTGLLEPAPASSPRLFKLFRHMLNIAYPLLWLLLLKVTQSPDKDWCSALLIPQQGDATAKLAIFHQYATLFSYAPLPIPIITFLYGCFRFFNTAYHQTRVTALGAGATDSVRFSIRYAEDPGAPTASERVVLLPGEDACINAINHILTQDLRLLPVNLRNYELIIALLRLQAEHPVWDHPDLKVFLSLIKTGCMALAAYLLSSKLMDTLAFYTRSDRSDCIDYAQSLCNPGDTCLAFYRDPEYGPDHLLSVFIFQFLSYHVLQAMRDTIFALRNKGLHEGSIIASLASIGFVAAGLIGLAGTLLIPGASAAAWEGFLYGGLAGSAAGLILCALAFKAGLLATQYSPHKPFSLWEILALVASFGIIVWKTAEHDSAIAHARSIDDQYIEMETNQLPRLAVEAVATTFLIVGTLQGLWSGLSTHSVRRHHREDTPEHAGLATAFAPKGTRLEHLTRERVITAEAGDFPASEA
jgi:hypothetical protein